MDKLNSHNSAFIICSIVMAILLGCSQTYNLSTPEQSYYSYHKALQNKDIKGMSKCLDIGGGTFDENSAQVLARAFENKKIESHRIVEKQEVSETEANLVVEEVLILANNTKTKSKVKINYVKTDGGWKARSSETINIEQLK